jgi:hypothetical protein
VNSPVPTTRGQLIARWLSGATTLLFTFFQFVPWGPCTTDQNLEDSWIQVQHLAFLEHLQFGRDIVFTFGPWGFLFYGGYYPTTYLVTFVLWLVLSVVFWRAAWRIAHSAFDHEFISWCWLMLITATAYAGVAWVLLLCLVHFFVENRPFTMIEVMLVVSLSLLSLTQFIIFVLATVSVAAIVLDNILRQRCFPWILPVFGAGLLCFWIAAGQHVGNFGSYLRYSWQMTNGFTEAMMLTGSKEVQDISCFLVAAVVVSFIAGYAAWLRLRSFGIIPCLGICFILFTAFKYGYVRHDGHDLWGVKDLLLASLFSVAAFWPFVRKQGQWLAGASLLPTAAILLFLSFTYSHDAEAGLLGGVPKTSGIQGFFAPLELVAGRNPLRAAYEKHLADLREKFPLPHIKGNVDAYTWNLDPVFAHGLTYHPRPVIQSYSAYTPELAQLNAEFLRSQNAPENILINGSTSDRDFPPREDGLSIDDRFPSLDDGLSWPELLTRYDVQETEVSFVLLKQSPQPRQFHLVPLTDIRVHFGERIDVPPATNGPIWAKMELDQTLWGRVVSALYKPPMLLLDVSTRGGQEPVQKRLVPGMARGGFLLSPLVEGCTSFALLASTEASSNLADYVIASMRIITADGSSAAAYYHDPVRVRLYRLEYPKQNLEQIAGFRQATRLEQALRHSRLLYADDLPQLVYDPGEGTVLEIPQNSEILFPVPEGARRLKVGFGIRGGDNTGPQPQVATKLVFRVLAVNRQRQGQLLWSQQLDPAVQRTDQERQEARIELDGLNLSGIMLQTLSVERNSANGVRGYWSEVDFQ